MRHDTIRLFFLLNQLCCGKTLMQYNIYNIINYYPVDASLRIIRSRLFSTEIICWMQKKFNLKFFRKNENEESEQHQKLKKIEKENVVKN